jgi:hypothetical protein
MVAETQFHHSQRETQLVPETQLSALSQLSKPPSVELSSSKDSDSDSDRSGRLTMTIPTMSLVILTV